ncbi:MAG: hypothetical protein A2275_18915 [Bacteroidetes bacterium RIFOXYA12_FULL_35_11]|nr:MAG: hypothetical protein A2X01_12750 [Bacteroidetes bacterium GWF2_35_48]OFY78836.1 MAG: hypothetical protein A2275_18915 [Bacteroidetes bacterium RIFOXYA12_FULL_35_11]OFZ06530.1 MAG: hypothetical protein A2491_10535 [Bacteroidetes bacterium RIFOXYC12_FULL_35_7]HBX50319.1 hypothetical protein [Bacteroidales bacterium]
MNLFLQKLIINLTFLGKKAHERAGYLTKRERLQILRNFRINLKRSLLDTMFISMGVLSAGFGLRGFLLPNKFVDGGATGVSLLISQMTGLELAFLLITINIPFIFLGYKVIGKLFSLKTALAITSLAICVAVFPYPEITNDKLLVAVFGGFFLGSGIGLSIRGGAVIDGTEVLAIYLSKKIKFTIGDIILIINIVIFSFAAYLLSVEAALYSILTYISASKMVDYITEGIEEFSGVTIISKHSDKIREMIINKMGRGVTIFKGERGFENKRQNVEINIVYTVITRLEINKLQTEIEKIDENAFIVINSIKDTKGGMIKKRPLKKL